jgi:protease-4
MAERRHSGFGGFVWTVLEGINLVRLVILNIVFFGLLALILVLIAHKPAPLAKGTVLVLAPHGQLVEQYSTSPLARALDAMSGQDVRQVRVRDLVGAIDRARRDANISRIVLLPEHLSTGGFAAVREVGAALDRFRAAGKKVTVWASQMDQHQYVLDAHANRGLLDPMGSIMLTGLASYRLYYKDLLDKLGATVHLFLVGKFKSAAEPYVRASASDASKAEDRAWMGGLWNQWIAAVAKARQLKPGTLRTNLDHWPQALKTMHGDAAKLAEHFELIDGLATREQLVAMLRRQGVAAGEDGHGFRHVDLRGYLARVRAHPTPGRHADVAIVVAEGDIAEGAQPPGRIGGASTAALIREARHDPSIKALVLRVNSPGGAVYAAEQIRREVALTRKAGKPVVVSMGDVAASGGYWISMNANVIYAEPDTITGSIGIFGLLYNIPGTLDKLGVHSDGVGVGPLPGAFDVTRPLDPKVAAMVQSTIDKGYHDFVSRVAKARGKSYAAIDKVAQGRVWTGRQAQARDQVDKLGGLHDATRAAAKLAHLGTHYSIGYLEPEKGGFGRFLEGLSRGSLGRTLRAHGMRLPDWTASLAHRAAPDLALFRQAQPGRPAVYAYCFCSAR